MEYEKVLISLYEKAPLPKGFISLSKESERIVLSINVNVFYSGYVYVYSNKKIQCFKVEKNGQKFTLNSSFKIEGNYVFMYFSTYILEGAKGKDVNLGDIVKKIKIMHSNNMKKEEECKELYKDKNYVVDKIMSKLFNEQGLEFFESSKKQLLNVFCSYERSKKLEEVFKESKFVSVGDGEDNSYVGIIYKKNIPYAIAIGVSDMKSLTEKKQLSCYQYFDLGEGEGCFLSFRRASDGDNVFILREEF